jgi:hypothetical protein
VKQVLLQGVATGPGQLDGIMSELANLDNFSNEKDRLPD